MWTIRKRIWLLSMAIVLSASFLWMTQGAASARQQEIHQAQERTRMAALLLEQYLHSFLSGLPEPGDLSAAEQGARFREALQPLAAELTNRFPDAGVGYVFPDLNVTISSGPDVTPPGVLEAVRQTEPPAETLRLNGETIVTVLPVMRDGRAAGHIWAYTSIHGWMDNYAAVIGRSRVAFLSVLLLALLGTWRVTRQFAGGLEAFKQEVLQPGGDGTTVQKLLPELAGVSQEIRNNRQRLLETERELQRIVTVKVIEAQEEERKRVAQELHDGIGQAIYSIFVGLKIMSSLKMEPSIRNHLSEMEQLTQKTMDEVKRMAMELRPSALDDLGLLPAIRNYVKKYEYGFGIEVRLDVQAGQRRYDRKAEVALYRILQESLTNAAKYSGTDKVDIRMIETGDGIVMSIRDYGKGFRLDETANRSGLGLYGMRERAEYVGGTLSIQSAPGEGTTIEVRVPLHELAAAAAALKE